MKNSEKSLVLATSSKITHIFFLHKVNTAFSMSGFLYGSYTYFVLQTDAGGRSLFQLTLGERQNPTGPVMCRSSVQHRANPSVTGIFTLTSTMNSHPSATTLKLLKRSSEYHSCYHENAIFCKENLGPGIHADALTGNTVAGLMPAMEPFKEQNKEPVVLIPPLNFGQNQSMRC